MNKYVVYPGHGVGVIKNTSIKSIAGKKIPFYELEILTNCNKPIKIIIPVCNAEERLRDLATQKEVEEVYTLLKNKEEKKDYQSWRTRYVTCMEKINTGKLTDIARVFKSLASLTRDLSFGERKMLECAKNLLVKEMSIINKVSEEKVETKLLNCLSR